MALVKIDGVEKAPLPDGLLGASLDRPRAGEGEDGYSFDLRGWAIGRDSAVAALELLDGERVAAQVTPDRKRPDVAAAFPGVAGAEECGFEGMVRALELQPRFELELVARLEDGSRRPLGTLRGRRARLAVPRTPALNPVMITTIGRSGSKWLAWLLSCHPAVSAFQPLVFEPRLATYWTTVFRELSAPRSYLRQIHAERWDEPRWWLGDGAGPMPAPVDLGMAEWLGAEGVGQLAGLCQERIEAFYLEASERMGKTAGVRYFAEKFLLDPVLLDLTTEIFPGAREVILVRDFRDRLSSVFAWNEKRGEAGFGHDAQMSQADYLTERVRVDAEELLQRWRRRGDAAHLVRYEDLILEPERTLARLFAYLDVESDPETVETLLEVANRPSDLLDGHRTVSDPTQTIGRWRRDLPTELAAECNEILAPVLEAFGYSVALSPSGSGV
jgi:Sulfotransferase family